MKPVLCWVLERPLLQDMGLCHALQQLWPVHAVACTAPHDSPRVDSPANWPGQLAARMFELLLVDATLPATGTARTGAAPTPALATDSGGAGRCPRLGRRNLADACVPGGLTLHGLAQRLREVADELHQHNASTPPAVDAGDLRWPAPMPGRSATATGCTPPTPAPATHQGQPDDTGGAVLG